MIEFPRFTLLRTIQLAHHGDCALIGLDAARRVAIEETYDDWVACHLIDFDGKLIASSDEDSGKNPDPAPLPGLDGFRSPPPVGRAAALNYTAGRWRGLREQDRIADVAQRLSVAEKMALAPYRAPTPILGIAESYVLAEAVISPTLSLVCRRLRIAYAVTLRNDADGLPYDYDTQTLYLTQWFDLVTDEAPLDRNTVQLGARPMDVCFDDDFLFVADGGDTARRSALHLFRMES